MVYSVTDNVDLRETNYKDKIVSDSENSQDDEDLPMVEINYVVKSDVKDNDIGVVDLNSDDSVFLLVGDYVD